MRIAIFSDLHNEFGKFKPGDLNADVIILAGDIHVGLGFRPIFEYWRGPNPDAHILYLPGNHEYYNQELKKTDARFRTWFSKEPKTHFLQNSTYSLGGSTFIGATLWTDMGGQNETAMVNAQMYMNDYKQIKFGNRSLQPRDTVMLHRASVAFIERELKKAGTSAIICTHHAPCFKSLAGKYKNDEYSMCYASDLSNLILDYKPRVWIHGHVHHSNRYMLGDTLVISNPRGYASYELNPDFDPTLTIEI